MSSLTDLTWPLHLQSELNIFNKSRYVLRWAFNWKLLGRVIFCGSVMVLCGVILTEHALILINLR